MIECRDIIRAAVQNMRGALAIDASADLSRGQIIKTLMCMLGVYVDCVKLGTKIPVLALCLLAVIFFFCNLHSKQTQFYHLCNVNNTVESFFFYFLLLFRHRCLHFSFSSLHPYLPPSILPTFGFFHGSFINVP